ncbi:MAG: carboxypeptidase-like regulatory domain-containing protein, partial [Acidobacteriota bacterium]
LAPGQYTLHAEADGDLPEDPKIQLYARGCGDVTLFRILRIGGRVVTQGGLPAARAEVQFRSVQGVAGDGAMTGPDGRYALRILRPGRYYVGINLNHTATRDSPYPRWFYPGTADPALAVTVDFTGKPIACRNGRSKGLCCGATASPCRERG